MKATEREMRILVKELDQKETGAIEYDEFLNTCICSYIYLKEMKLRQAFARLDTEKSGYISIEQMKDTLSSAEFAFPNDALERIFRLVLGIDLN